MSSNNTKSLAKQTVLYGVPSILGRFLNYLLVPLYTYTLTNSSDYGIISNLYAWVAVGLVILTFGLETGFFRFSKKDQDNSAVRNTLFSTICIFSGIFFLSVLLFSNQIAAGLHLENYKSLIYYTAIILVFDACSAIPFAQLRFQNRALRFSSLKMINILINIVLNVILFILIPFMQKHEIATGLYKWFHMEHFVNYVFIANVASSTISFILLMISVPEMRYKFHILQLKPIVSYSFPIFLVGLAGIINQSGDKLLYPFLFEDVNYAQSQLGIYAANFKMGLLMVLFTQAFRYAYEPFIFSQNKDQESKKVNAEVLKYFLFVALLGFLSVTGFIDLFKKFIGPDYHEGLFIIPIVLMSNLLFGIFFNLSVWYKVTDRTRFGAYLAGIGSVITILGNIIFVPKFGFVASAWSSLVCYSVMVLGSYLLMKKYYPIPYNVGRLVSYIVIALLMFYGFQTLNIKNEWLKYSYTSLNIIVFIAAFVILEKINIKKLIHVKG